jgi:hypothetical protein
MQARVRSRHETLNSRLKNWGILAQVYRHDIREHGIVFQACAVVTQLMIANEEPLLLEVEYGDKGLCFLLIFSQPWERVRTQWMGGWGVLPPQLTVEGYSIVVR